MELRFIERDGKKVLQQKIHDTYGSQFDKWEDVPFIQEEKTERDKICDELISVFQSTGNWETSHVVKIIEKIRDRK